MDCRQEEIVNGLLKSYQEVGGINHLDCSNLPSKRVVAGLCEDLLHLLFMEAALVAVLSLFLQKSRL